MDARREEGIALVIAVMAMLLMGVIVSALVLATTMEAKIATGFLSGIEALHATDAVVEYAMDELTAAPDWSLLLDGSIVSGFIDGPASGPRAIGDGTAIDLSELVNVANCRTPGAPCSAGALNAVTSERPWGTNNPRWRLYAYGHLSSLVPSATGGPCCYVVVMVSDNPGENDGDPFRDGASPGNPGSGVSQLRAEAFGWHGARRTVEVTVANTRADEVEDDGNRESGDGSVVSPLHVLSWREL